MHFGHLWLPRFLLVRSVSERPLKECHIPYAVYEVVLVVVVPYSRSHRNSGAGVDLSGGRNLRPGAGAEKLDLAAFEYDARVSQLGCVPQTQPLIQLTKLSSHPQPKSQWPKHWLCFFCTVTCGEHA